MDLVQRRQQLRQKQVEKVKKFRQSNQSSSTPSNSSDDNEKSTEHHSDVHARDNATSRMKAKQKSNERQSMKNQIKRELSQESINIENSDGVTFARVMDIVGPSNMKPLVSGGLWKGTEQISEKKSDCECDDCGQDPCIECGESHHNVKEAATTGPGTEDANQKQIDSKQKKADQIKKQVLLKKLQAVRSGGGSEIMASYDWRSDDSMRINKIFEGKKKGLWDNIHAKRKRGEKPAKPGDKDYPKTLDVE